jgi:uncharacterized protein YegP (UPF0339 family)
MIKIHIDKRKNGDIFFTVTDENNQEIFMSDRYASKHACMNGIEKVREYGSQREFYAKRISFDAKYIFYLTGIVGIIFGMSEFWDDEVTRDKNMQKMIEGIKNAELIENLQIY